MKRTSSLGRPYCLTISASNLSSFASAISSRGEPQGALEIVDDRPEGAVDVVGGALETQLLRALCFSRAAQGAEVRLLPMPGSPDSSTT